MKRQNRKNVADVAGVHSMRTLHSTGRRSVPRGYQGSAFIELYMLAKERDRLEKEISVMDRRQKVIVRRLKDIGIETDKLKALEIGRLAEGGRGIRKSLPFLEGHVPKDWKKLALHY